MAKIKNPMTVIREESTEHYAGPYDATPTRETQTFSTNGKKMDENFVVNPIPSCYGLITYNGFEMTVT